MKYHVNPNSGEVNRCSSTKRPCPYGEGLHRDSEQDARGLAETRLEKEYFIRSFYEPESKAEMEFLLAYDVRKYGKEKLTTVDNVIFDEEAGKVLLIRRNNYPWRGQYALPGGFIDGSEEPAKAAIRELLEETNLQLKGDPESKGHLSGDRIDPRGDLETEAFLAKVDSKSLNAQAGDDADEVLWAKTEDLESMKKSGLLVPHHLTLIQNALHEDNDEGLSADEFLEDQEYEEGGTYEDEYGREWIYSSTPSIPDPSRLEQKLAHEYWNENFESWTTGWLNPDEANGLCTDSAESFTAWANKNGYSSYVLDLNRDGGPHTVSVVETDRGPMVVDFTYRQFDNECEVPLYMEKEAFLARGDWEVTDEYSL